MFWFLLVLALGLGPAFVVGWRLGTRPYKRRERIAGLERDVLELRPLGQHEGPHRLVGARLLMIEQENGEEVIAHLVDLPGIFPLVVEDGTETQFTATLFGGR